MKNVFAIIATLIVVGSSVPAARAVQVEGFGPKGLGYYDKIQFTNTTPWCVQLTTSISDLPNGLAGWHQVAQQDVDPNAEVIVSNHGIMSGGPVSSMINGQRIKLDVGVYATFTAFKVVTLGKPPAGPQLEVTPLGRCSGLYPNPRELEKAATQPIDPTQIEFEAIAQFDHAGALSSPVFNFYFGPDKVDGSQKCNSSSGC